MTIWSLNHAVHGENVATDAQHRLPNRADGNMSVYTPTDVDCFRRCFCPKLPILNYFIAHIRILQIHKLWQPFGRFIFFYDLFALCVLYANNGFKRVDMQVLESTSYKLLQTETTGKWSELQWLSQKSGRFCWHLCITGPRRDTAGIEGHPQWFCVHPPKHQSSFGPMSNI